MSRQSITIDVAADTSRVWAVMADVERWPEWTASVSRVTLLDGPLGVGARAEIEQPRIPRTVWTVRRIDVGHEFVWEAEGPGVHTVATHEVVEISPGQSRVTLTVEQSGPVGSMMGMVYRRLTDRYLGLESAGLKATVEA